MMLWSCRHVVTEDRLFQNLSRNKITNNDLSGLTYVGNNIFLIGYTAIIEVFPNIVIMAGLMFNPIIGQGFKKYKNLIYKFLCCLR